MIMKRNHFFVAGLAAICLTLLSFSSKPGGEGFEVFLNNKLILQQFGTAMNKVQSVSLPEGTATDQLVIRYHHCGKSGKNRTITVKNEEEKVLKVYTYTDNPDPVAAMSCKVNELFLLQKGISKQLKIYYTSSELPGGRQLATIQFSKNNQTNP